MQAYSLIVLCLINISVGCYPTVDKNSDFEATIIGGNGQFDVYQDCGNDCPYTSYDSGIGVIGGSSNYYGNIAIPQGKIHIQPYNVGPGYVRTLPSSDFNTVVGDSGRLITYNKVTAYPSYSGYSNVEKGKPYTSGINWLYPGYNDDISYNGLGENDRYPSYDKGKQYLSDNYYTRVGPNDNSLPELTAESSSDDSTNFRHIGPKKFKNTGLHRILNKLYKKFSGPKLQERPEASPNIGEKVDIPEYDGLARSLCPQCKPYQDSYTYPKSKDVLRQIYDFGLG